MSSMKRLVTKQLGELLVERGIITPAQLQEALKLQSERGGLLGQVLVSMGFAKEEEIAQVLTVQYGFPYLPLSNYEIDAEVVATVPENICRQFRLVPIDKIGKSLTLAMANPLDVKAIEEVESLSGCTVQAFVSTAGEIKKTVEKYYPASA